MLPTKSDYRNLHLFDLIGISNKYYYKQLSSYYEDKKLLFKISLIIDLPIVLVLSLFATIHFNYPWWSFFIFFLIISFFSFFIICLPTFHSLTKDIREKEALLFKKADEELSDLATNHFFSNDSKVNRLLNQNFELIKLQPVSSKNINLILNNKSLATQTIDFFDKSNKKKKKSINLFYEQRPLKPIVLATINFLGDDKTLSIQATIPIEYEIVHGLVSEQIIYFTKEDYYINPFIYIDQTHFQELYQFD